MDTDLQKLLEKDYVTLEENASLHKAINAFTGSRHVIVLHDKERNYKGLLTMKDSLRAGADSKQVQVKSLKRNAPRLSQNTNTREALRLMIENNLFYLPVFDSEENMIGLVTADNILKSITNKQTLQKPVEDVMSKNVRTMHPDATIAQAMTFFRDHAVSRIPVEKQGKLVGLVTVKDVVEKGLKPKDRYGEHEFVDEKKSALTVPLKGIMTKNLFTVNPKATLKEAIELMLQKDISGTVVEIRDEIKGIVTKKDILQEVYYQSSSGEDDGQIIIQLSTKMKDVNRQGLLKETTAFAEKFGEQLGPGTINLHLTKHKETLRGQPLVHTRLRIRCTKENHTVTGEGWGEEHSLRIVLRKVRGLILKNKAKHEKADMAEYLDYADLTTL